MKRCFQRRSLLLGILLGIVSFIFGLCINVLDAAVVEFASLFGFSFSTFEKYFPAAESFRHAFVAMACALLFLLYLFSIFKNFGRVFGVEAESPINITVIVFIAYGAIMFSDTLMDYFMTIFGGAYNAMSTVSNGVDTLSFSIIGLVENIVWGTITGGLSAIVYLILILILGWQFLKLMLECIERYIVLVFVMYSAPVFIATAPFKTTKAVFQSWCRLLFSQGFVTILNIWCLRLFISFTAYANGNALDEPILILFMGLGFLKFAQRIDTLLRILGLNTSHTGADMAGGLLRTAGNVAHTMFMASRMAGGGSKRGDSKSTAHSGGGANADAAGGIPGMTGGAAGSGVAPGVVSSMGGASGGSVGGEGATSQASGHGSSGAGADNRNSANFGMSAKGGDGGFSSPYDIQDSKSGNVITPVQAFSDLDAKLAPQNGEDYLNMREGSNPLEKLDSHDKANLQNAVTAEGNKKMSFVAKQADRGISTSAEESRIHTGTLEKAQQFAHGIPGTFDEKGEMTGDGLGVAKGSDANAIGGIVFGTGNPTFQRPFMERDQNGGYKTKALMFGSGQLTFSSIGGGIAKGSITTYKDKPDASGNRIDHKDVGFTMIHSGVANSYPNFTPLASVDKVGDGSGNPDSFYYVVPDNPSHADVVSQFTADLRRPNEKAVGYNPKEQRREMYKKNQNRNSHIPPATGSIDNL